MTLWKPKFMTVFVAVIIGVVITFLLLIFRMFSLGFIGIGILCLLFPLLGRLSSEEWVIFVLKRNGGSCEYNNSNLAFSKKTISRFEKRGIVIIADNIVTLVDPNYPCIFDEPNE